MVTILSGTIPIRQNLLAIRCLSEAVFVRSLGSGLFALMPMGMRVIDRVKTIMRVEFDALGGQEMELPLVVPQHLWSKTGREQLIGKELIRFKDRSGHALVLSTSHLEPITQLARLSINSYRDFPRFLYQFKNKFRDEERVRCGLFRAKEFTMSDAYSFHRSYTDLNSFFPKVFKAYSSIFQFCGIDFFTAESAVGSLSGDRAYEFLMECDWGDNKIINCPTCGYRANIDVAVGFKETFTNIPLTSKEISTPGCNSKEKLMKYLDVPAEKIAVTTLYKTLNALGSCSLQGRL